MYDRALTSWRKTFSDYLSRSWNECVESVKKGDWTPEEDKIMFEMQQQIGSQWTKIAEYLPGRTENSIKNRYYCTLRKFSAVPKKKVSLPVPATEDIAPIATQCATQFVEPADDEVCCLVRQITLLEELLSSTR